MKQEGYFEGRHTRKLFYQSWVPETGKIKAHIIALHGLGTNSNRLENLALFLNQKGYSLFTFDLRGHYRNVGDNPGHIEDFDNLIKDVVLFEDIVKSKGENRPIFIIGQCLGALIALLYAIEHPSLPGVVVSAPLLNLDSEVLEGSKLGKRFKGSMTKLSPMKIIDFTIEQNKLTSDLKLLRKFIADKNKLNRLTHKSYNEITEAIDLLMDNISQLTCPIFILQGSNDKITDSKKVKKLYKKIKSEDKNMREYPNFLHDLWNEKGRAQVFRDLYVWLEKHL